MDHKSVLGITCFDNIFPYYFVVNESLHITDAGKMLLPLLPIERDLGIIFDLLGPVTVHAVNFAYFLTNINEEFTFRLHTSNNTLLFKGHFLFSPDQNLLLFCSNPTFQDVINEQENASQQENVADHSVVQTTIEKGNYNFFESILNSIPSEIAVFDKDLRFVYINSKAISDERLREWLIGKTDKDYWEYRGIVNHNANKRLEVLKEVRETLKPVSFEEVLFKGTDMEKVMLRIVHPYIQDGVLVYLITYGADVSQLSKNSIELAAKNVELEKINYDLDKFVYSASHNLRTPILSILGVVNLISDSLDNISTEELSSFLEHIRHSVKRMDETINDIINYSKNARLEVESKVIDIEKIAADIFNDVRYFSKKAISIKIQVDAECSFYSDEFRVKSLINNVISNAVKYSKESEEGAIVEIMAVVTNTKCSIKIKDNGEGIANDQQDRVFQMFYRASNKVPGSGLGLYLCKDIVTKLGGDISMESTLGVGTTFIINLPNNILSKI